MESTIEDLALEAKGVLESRKRVDEEIQKLNSEQERKEEILLDKLMIVRRDKIKHIKKEQEKRTAFDTARFLELNDVMAPYVIERGFGKISFIGIDALRSNAITKLKIDDKVLTRDDNPTLIDFVNGDLGVIYDDKEHLTGHYYSEPILEKIFSTDGKYSLEFLRLRAIELAAYDEYLRKDAEFVCAAYGHDWQLDGNIEYHYDSYSGTDKFVATYRCKDCYKRIEEIFDHASDVKPLPSVRRRMDMLKLDAKEPEFKLEDYFVKVDRPKKMEKKISNK